MPREQTYEQYKEEILREVLQPDEEWIDGVFLCSDDFMIIDDWETMGRMRCRWASLVLPADYFRDLVMEVEEAAREKYLERCGNGRMKPDFDSYMWSRHLESHWGLYADRMIEQKLEDVEEAEKREYTAEQYLDTSPFRQHDWGFSDEYSYCMDCLKSIRTEPDCYFWKLEAWFVDGEGYLCPDCVSANPDDYIEAKKNRLADLNLDFVGEEFFEEWERLEDEYGYHRFQNGFMGGQVDDPQKQIELLNAKDVDVLFTLYPSQFYMEWELWVPTGRVEEAWEILEGGDTRVAEDPAVVCERNLRANTDVSEVRKESECTMGSGPDSANIPHFWLSRHPTMRVDPTYWIEFKKRHDALPQPVSEDDWFKLAEALDQEMR